jgi:Z1 domain
VIVDEYRDLLMVYRIFLDLMRLEGMSVDEAISWMKRQFGEKRTEEVVKYWRQLAADQATPTAGVALIRGLGAAEPWYPGPSARDQYWNSLRDHLVEHPKSKWSEEQIGELDLASSLVLASCRSPWDETSSGRGLVVGYVQSGKTTNFTAVIAKAADAGFRLFIVLSGTTKSLRQQTQKRLEEQLKNLNPHAWYFHTTQDGDIGRAINWVPFLGHKEMRTCIVVKKNKKRLQNLNRSLNEAERLGILKDCPILVIDDEGDNASLSPNCDQAKATAINKEIVKAVNRPRATYLSYTATPFANCFVDADYEENLFPRDFIAGLPEPEGYFGSRRLHGSSHAPEVQAVVDVPEQEVFGYLQPEPSDFRSLEEAVRWFLLASTVRRIRNGGVQPHCTMLVNVSERIETHERYWQYVRDMVKKIDARTKSGDAALRDELEALWERETALVDPHQFGLAAVPFSDIMREIGKTIEGLGPLGGSGHNDEPECGIVVDNSESAYRLAYDDEQPRAVIVVGGNTLSRGLTLEGLVCTFFLRSARLYDTLLQMGRWFGYRYGYEDLFRIWMPRLVRERFEFLARIEVELRDWIDVFARTGRTPLELGPKFRLHPQMQVTRAALMKRSRVERLNLAGTQPETSVFENTTEAVQRHQQAAVSFAASLGQSSFEPTADGSLFREVPAEDVVQFFDAESGFRIVGHTYLSNQNLLEYIATKRRAGELESWNVLFRKTRGGRSVPFLPHIDASLVTRSRKDARDQYVDIGSLADSGDKWADVPQDKIEARELYRAETPLLVIYVIDKDSKASAKAQRYGRVDLDALDHLIGVALFLPHTEQVDDLGDFACPTGPWDKMSDDQPAPEPDMDADDEGDAEPTLPVSQ